ncbi:MAG TPA: PAS domain S-box protein [Candidatus Ozemobacteraceae bacterium]|nr:PAS domain S-box protein [Candidatus Ozemobacteraceae bacterium]
MDQNREATSECQTTADERLFREIFDRNCAIKLLIDPQTGRIEDANTAAVEFYGYSPDTLRGMNISDINTLPQEAVIAEMRKAKAGTKGRFVFSHRIASGEIREVEVFSSAITLHGRNLLLSIVHDLSELKRTERSLRDIEHIFNLFLEHSPILVYFKDEQGRALKVSRNFEHLIGCPVEAIIGKTMFELFPSDFAKKMVEDDLKVLREGKAIDISETFNNRHYRSVKFPILENGRPHLLAGFTIDMTDQVRANLERQKMEEHLQLTLEATHSSSFDNNFRTGEVLTTPALYEFLGYGADELPKNLNDVYALIHPDDLDAVNHAIQEHNAGKTHHYYAEFRLKSKSGEWIWANGLGKIIERDEHGQPERLIGISTEIHYRRTAEEEKKKLEDQIRQTQKLESLGILAGGIAHDFNNLLTGIFGNIEMAALHCSAGSPAKEFLDKARSVFNRAHNLTKQLLTFSKGGAPSKKTGNVSKLLRDSSMFAISGSKAACLFDIAEDLWLCDYDENQLSQVIDNIVINARQAMPEEGLIRVSAHNVQLEKTPVPRNGDGRYVQISIADTGVGISPEVRERIFEPFFSTKQCGSGLGLATAFSVVKRHGGFITVDSAPGAGSVFHIYLPASQRKAETETAAASGIDHHGQGTILVMDDEPALRELLSILLRQMGYEPLCTADGQQAIQALQELRQKGGTCAGAILDLTIQGGMGGKAAGAELHRIDPTLRIFATSGYSDDPVMANPEQYGFAGKIEKPYLLKDLAEILNRELPGGSA